MTRLEEFEATVWPLVNLSTCAKVTITTDNGDTSHFHLRAGENRALVSLTPRFEIVESLVDAVAFTVRVPTPGSDLMYGFLWCPGDTRPIRMSKSANRDAQVHDASGALIGDEPGVMYC
jgi:hypothetical protein